MRNNLINVRKEKKLTQSQVADMLNISLRQYQRIECGDTVGKIKTWDALEKIFETDQKLLRD